MAHPYAGSRAKEHDRAKRVMDGCGYSSGGHVDERADAAMIRRAISEHEEHDHPGQKKTKLKFKAGGAIEGKHAASHMGKRARGGATKGGKHVTNVIVAPQGGMGAGMHPPMPMGQPMAARPMAPPPPRPAAPPQAPGGMPPGAGGPPMGMRPPGAMKRGGGVKHRGKRAEGGSVRGTGDKDLDDYDSARAEARRQDALDEEQQDERPAHRARGGRTQKVQEVGVPSESLMQANRGGHVRKREFGGNAGVPADPTTMTARKLQRIAQLRKEMAARPQAPSGAGMEGPMGAAEAARMSGAPMQKRGGEVHVREHKRRARGGHVTGIEAGAGGGEGRIEKARAYGAGRGFTPKKVPAHA